MESYSLWSLLFENLKTNSYESGSLNTDIETLWSCRSYGVRSRREGNMYRLSADDEDDESATWNGNSTQQM